MSQRPPLAVVGYAYRAPGVGRKGLFEFLEQGKSAWSKVPEDRFNHAAYYHPEHSKPGFISSKGGHFLPDDLYAFDPAFFNIKADEARSMDPQHRLLLECAYEAAESAGLTLRSLMGANIGVFAAGDKSEYYNSEAQDLSTSSIFTATGINPCMFSNRLSYFFGLTGPSVTVDAACASSSYAIHLACQSILAGECSAAFVGGAKTLNGPNQWIELDTMGTLSAEGKCFSYDARASGFGRGEGAACIIIKPMSDAMACGDPVRSVILNSAANHSGRTQGISMPGRKSQEALLARLHHEVGCDPHLTTYVEGHGTGTPVGDPIEAGSIVSVLASRRSSSNPLYIGSVKSNLGHIENASGLISLIKCIMMLENETLLPNTNFTEFNPKIEGSERLQVPVQSMAWPVGAEKRICMSNFVHANGTATATANGDTNGHSNGHTNGNGNGHAKVTGDATSERLLVFSAKSQTSLHTYMSSFKTWLQHESNSASFFENLSFTLGQRRSQHSHRHAVSADSTESLRRILESVPVGTSHGVTKAPVLAFIFTGQGAQYAQMASGLQMFDVFKQTMADAEKTLLKLGATWQLQDELLKPQVLSRIDDAEISQPVCTAVQLALIALLRSWGVIPAAVLGHSSGEIAAAYAAGFISFEASLAIAYFRGLAASRVLAHDGVKGAMLAVGASPEEAEKLFPPANSGDAQVGYATIAAVNSPESVTISGDISAIDYIHERAEEQGLFVRRLKVGVAYHSKHMDHVSASYLEAIEPFCSSGATKNVRTSEIAFISSVTGEIETSAPSQAAYWVRNLLQPVLYSQAVQSLFSSPKGESLVQTPDVVIEVGPHAALQNPTKYVLDRVKPTHGGVASQPSVQYLPSLVRGKDASKSMVDLAGKLFVKGAEIDLEAINRTRGSRVSVLHDLPPYEWNKASRYLHRPRVGTTKLFGGQAYHKLLGWQSPYTEGAEHAFRNVFTLDDLPWIRDHVVGGNTLFPFTGFVSLAVEALKVVLRCAGGVEKPLGGFVLREFHVTSSLKIEEDQSVDMTTKLRPAEAGSRASSSTAWSFEILSWTEAGGWERHAYGVIEGETDSDKAMSKSLAVQAGLKTLGDGSLRQLNADHEYELLQENYKVCYGPAFRTAVDFWLAPDVMVHTMVVRGIEPSTFMPDSPQHSLVTADPPTLDAIMHSFGALQKGSGPRATIVPSYCREWRISNDIAATTGQRLSVVSRCLSHDPKSGNMEMDFVVFDVGSSAAGPKAVAEIGPLKFQCIARPDPSELCLPDTFVSKNIPYLDLMDGAELVRAIERDQPADVDVLESEISHRRDLDQAALHYISLALKEDYSDRGAAPDHLVGFSDWAEGILTRYPADNSLDKDALLSRVASSNATGELVCSVGRQLPSILRGEKQALEVMLENGLLWRTYAENVAGIRANVALAGYLQRLLAVHPDLKILEMGAGTASATLPVLQAIEKGVEGAEPTFTYTFTDISSGFFDNAREKLSSWSDRMNYKKLDISQDPATQGFSAQSYDVILASNVLHATPDILATLHNVGNLLRPGGKLVLMEGVVSPPPSFIPYALLPGWWLFEDDFRIDGPLLTKDSWDTALKTTGFSGVEGSVDDYPGRPEQLFSALWSTKLPPAQTAAQLEGSQGQPETVTQSIIYRCSDSDAQCLQFAEELSVQLKDSTGKLPTMLPITEACIDSPCALIPIIIDGKQESIFGSAMTPEVYQKLKDILVNNPDILWVLPQGGHPDSSMIKGLLRTLRLELPSSRLVLLEAPLDSHGTAAVEQLLDQYRQGSPSKLHLEQEYVLIDNILHVPRVLLAADKRETFAIEAGLPVKTNQPLGQDKDKQERSLEATIEAVGSPDSVYFQHSDVLKNAHNLAPDQIIVEVEAAGLNFIDLLTVLGSLAWSPLGLEGVGTVRQVGSSVKGLCVGDRVIYAVDKAGMGTHVRMQREYAHAIPSGMAAGDAASMPIAFSTAILTLLEVGRLRKDDSVLIHCASGATGQALLQIAQNQGCTDIFVTAGTPEKRAFLAETYGIPADHIFSSRNGDFKLEILAATSNSGVDVIVNCLSGSLLQQTWDLVADGGRFLEIGKKDLLDNSHLSMRHFLRNVSFSGIDLRRTIATQPKAVQRYLSTIVRMLAEGAITPIRPVTLLPASRLTEGLRKLQGGKNIGKVVITFTKDDVVLAESPSALKIAAASVANSHQAASLLRHDGTYVIAGGTGGIGRALVPWMVEMGAKSVVMLGRSALSNPRVKAILKQFDGTDVVVRAIPCDVGSADDMNRAVEAIKDLPRVCGVVHSAIALRDSFFSNLSYDDWQATAKSRIQGAWNLNDFFPDLDFFVSFSGMTGITGNAGQSVYTGTSTFLEAFVDHRHQRGHPATVIHLPPVSGIGLVAETNLIQRLRSTIGAVLRGTEVLTLVEAAILGSSAGLAADGKHLSWSLVPGSEVATLPWEHFNPLSAMSRRRHAASSLRGGSASGSPDGLAVLMSALSDKVSAMTAIERSEITPDRSLLDYGLDSLISLELRNWIRRNFDIDMGVKDINSSADLRVVAGRIQERMKKE
ncbi:polyketide synthase [Microdochium bolleyi]|uniref:Polyketide synthase n=1 Tax=Microdochium bolleyi TaxID=196109 RepID=A0A136J4U9_9PEZI|nr:polyketide synthase [Microdochium bolleyi]